MKTILFLIALIPTISLSQVPEYVPFSKTVAVPMALAAAESFVVEVSSADESNVAQATTYDLPLLHSKAELKAAINAVEINYMVNDPNKQINLHVLVLDAVGQPVLEAWNSFYLFEKGGKWYPPSNAGMLWFNVTDRQIFIKGAKSAQLMNRNGNVLDLQVVKGVVTSPSWALANDDWNAMEVTFADGSVVRYDGASGKRIRPANAALQDFGMWGIDNLVDGEIQDGVLTHSAQPQYGWNPGVEVTIASKGFLTLDVAIREWNEWVGGEYVQARPTKVFVTTCDDIRAGIQPVEYDFNPDGLNNDEVIEIPLEIGTYYLGFSWSPQWQENSTSGGGGKGF